MVLVYVGAIMYARLVEQAIRREMTISDVINELLDAHTIQPA